MKPAKRDLILFLILDFLICASIVVLMILMKG
jgi:hypothetical protein